MKGVVEDVKGKAKEAVGNLAGQDELAREGKAQQEKPRRSETPPRRKPKPKRPAAARRPRRRSSKPTRNSSAEKTGPVLDTWTGPSAVQRWGKPRCGKCHRVGSSPVHDRHVQLVSARATYLPARTKWDQLGDERPSGGVAALSFTQTRSFNQRWRVVPMRYTGNHHGHTNAVSVLGRRRRTARLDATAHRWMV
ncbi:csbD family domain protein [Mycobacterium xenopi 3993]|nr:csbD family domain protein [Mycobacterium xenopi 3993]